MSVYFITAREVGRVKIGCADDPYERLATLQNASPISLVMEAFMAGSFTEERGFHVRFAEHRVHGEWFTITDEIELLITNFPAPAKIKPTWSERAKIRKALQPPKPSQEELMAERMERGRKHLEQCAKHGDIHFPFRAAVEETS